MRPPTDANGGDVERVGETETPIVEIRDDKLDTTAEVKADANSNEAVSDFDWEGYLDNQAAAAPMPSYKSNNEDLPSLEATLTRGTSLFDHLEWQLKLSHFTLEEDGIAMLIIGNLTPDGYLEEPLEDLAEEAAVTLEQAESVLKRVQEFDPVGVAARTLEECLLIQARHIGADDDVVVGIITKHLAQPREEELPGDRQGPGTAGRGDLRGGEGPQGSSIRSRGGNTPPRSRPTSRPTSTSTRWATSTSSSPTTTACRS